MYEEIKRLHRLLDLPAVWVILPERYAAIRTKLVQIHSSNPDFTMQQKKDLMAIIQDMRNMEAEMEGFLQTLSQPGHNPPTGIVKYKILAHEDVLHMLLIEAKKRVGE